MTSGRLRGAGLWAAATMIATGISFSAVALVTDRVTSASVVAPQAVSATAATVPAAAQEPDHSPPSTVAAVGRATAPTTPTVPTTTTSTPIARPRRPAATPASVPATFASDGGVATVTCEGGAIGLQSARPNDGYRLDVRKAGPDRVDIVFHGDRDDPRIVVECSNGVAVRHDGDAPAPTTTTVTQPGDDGGGDSGRRGRDGGTGR